GLRVVERVVVGTRNLVGGAGGQQNRRADACKQGAQRLRLLLQSAHQPSRDGSTQHRARNSSPDDDQTSRSFTKRAFSWMKRKRSSGLRPIRRSTRSSVSLFSPSSTTTLSSIRVFGS